jgi:hypothetical protein
MVSASAFFFFISLHIFENLSRLFNPSFHTQCRLFIRSFYTVMPVLARSFHPVFLHGHARLSPVFSHSHVIRPLYTVMPVFLTRSFHTQCRLFIRSLYTVMTVFSSRSFHPVFLHGHARLSPVFSHSHFIWPLYTVMPFFLTRSFNTQCRLFIRSLYTVKTVFSARSFHPVFLHARTFNFEYLNNQNTLRHFGCICNTESDIPILICKN